MKEKNQKSILSLALASLIAILISIMYPRLSEKYILIRNLVVCCFFIFMTYKTYCIKKITITTIFTSLFIIAYNPFWKVYLQKDEWLYLNILALVTIVYTVISLDFLPAIKKVNLSNFSKSLGLTFILVCILSIVVGFLYLQGVSYDTCKLIIYIINGINALLITIFAYKLNPKYYDYSFKIYGVLLLALFLGFIVNIKIFYTYFEQKDKEKNL